MKISDSSIKTPCFDKQALPCGLIINELVSNSIKHGFKPGDEGRLIEINLSEDQDEEITLSVSDNGVGLPEDFEFGHSKTLGLRLVRTLSMQLKGKIDIIGGARGATYRITFKKSSK